MLTLRLKRGKEKTPTTCREAFYVVGYKSQVVEGLAGFGKSVFHAQGSASKSKGVKNQLKLRLELRQA